MNLRPPVPQTGALTRLRYAPNGALLPRPGGKVNAGVGTGTRWREERPQRRQIRWHRKKFRRAGIAWQRHGCKETGPRIHIVNHKVRIRPSRTPWLPTAPDPEVGQRAADAAPIGLPPSLKPRPRLQGPRFVAVGQGRTVSNSQCRIHNQSSPPVIEPHRPRRLQIDADRGDAADTDERERLPIRCRSVRKVEVTVEPRQHRLAMRAAGKGPCRDRSSETPRDKPAQERAGNPPRTNELVVASVGTTKRIGALKIK